MPGPIAAVFLPWWGPAPGWEDRFIERASHSKRLKVVLVGDAAGWVPGADVPRIPVTMDEFEIRASKTAGVTIRKSSLRYPRGQAICELRCMMADIYPGIMQDFDWWGYGDWDVVWGDWDSYLTNERLAQFDMITSNSYSVNGCFVLFRQEFAGLYRERLDLMSSPEAHYMEESGMEAIVRRGMAADRMRCLYPVDLNAHDRHERWNRCCLRGNKLYRMDAGGEIGSEILKFHFPRTKRWPLEN